MAAKRKSDQLTQKQKDIIRHYAAEQGLSAKPTIKACLVEHGFELTESNYYNLKYADKKKGIDWQEIRDEHSRIQHDLRQKEYTFNLERAAKIHGENQMLLAEKLNNECRAAEPSFENLKCIKISLEANKLLGDYLPKIQADLSNAKKYQETNSEEEDIFTDEMTNEIDYLIDELGGDEDGSDSFKASA